MDQQRLAAMQELMNRMAMAGGGAGGGGGPFVFGGGGGGGGMGGQIGQILAKIKNQTNEVEQLDGLNEFINMLNMATEATIMSINPQHFVGPIMTCFQKHHNPELMLVAARSLTYLVDANTHTVRVLQRDDYLTVLLDSLRNIMDVEFAEQVLTCVDKISLDDPAMLLQRDGVSAIMGFLDFFSITTQRLILHTVARIADSFRPLHYSKIADSLPTIRACLRHDDNRMREESLTALTRFVKRAALDPTCVKNIFGDAGPAVMEILEKRPTNAMFVTAIQLISSATHASAAVCESMIEIGAVGFLASLLESNNNQSLVGGGGGANASIGGDPSSPLRNSGAMDASIGGGSSPMSPNNTSGVVNASSSNNPTASAATTQQRIPHERIIDICNCLVSFAPEIVDQKDYIAHIDKADRAEHVSSSSAAAAAAAASSHHGGRGKKTADRHRSDAKALLQALRNAGMAAGSSEDDDDHAHDDDDENEHGMFGDEEDDMMAFDEEDGNEHDEDYEDYNPHDLPPIEQKNHLEQLIRDGAVKIDNKIERNSRCTNGRHTCDECGARLTDPELWLRCNTRNDYDLCAACILASDGDEEHTFTLMKAVFPMPVAATAGSGSDLPTPTNTPTTATAATVPPRNPITGEEDQRAMRVRMIEKAPYLVNRLAEALPVMCRLHLHSDDKMIRTKCLTFICRVVHHATKDCLRQALLDCPMCELVTYLLTSTQLSVLGQCIHICGQLMTKLPDIYTDLFIREGVTNGLAVVKSGVSVDQRSEVATKPIATVVQTVEGWKAILAFTANEILNTFEDSVDSGRIAAMESLCNRLRSEADPSEAIKQAAEVLSDVSTFELMNSDIVNSILARFASTESPEELVARFVSQLASQSTDVSVGGGGDQQQQQHTTLLSRFVHQLQSSVSQIEKFTPPNDGSDNAKDPIRLSLKPHDPAAEAAAIQKAAAEAATEAVKKKGGKNGATTKAGRGGRKKGTSEYHANDDEENEGKNKGGKRGAGGKKASGKKKGANEDDDDNATPSSSTKKKGASSNNNDDEDDTPNATSSSSAAVVASAGVRKTEGKSATVSIDPLASVQGIVEFIRSNLLPNSSGPALGGSKKKEKEAASSSANNNATEDEDAIEDIDPTAVASPTTTAGSAAAAAFSFGAGGSEAATKRARKETSTPTSSNPPASSSSAASPPPPSPSETPIYLRYKTHALPNNWTMVQVMSQIVKKDKDRSSKKPSAEAQAGGLMGRSDLPWQLRQLLTLDQSQIVEIYYSTEPFTVPTVTKPLQPNGSANGSLNDRPVRFNPNLLLTSGAIAVRTALTKTYISSAPQPSAESSGKGASSSSSASNDSGAYVSPVLASILKLLNVLFAACSEWNSLMAWLAMQSGSWDLPKSLAEPRILFSEFVNLKINNKAMQHSSNIAMAGQHDQAWYVRILHDYPCLFTPATRKFLFEITYFGVSRSLVRLQELAQENGTLVDNERANAGRRQNRIVRRKCRVVREKPLECAIQVLSSSKATLGSVFEFEFKGEPGSGLGPTMEFYSLVGNALTEKQLRLWRRSEEDSETNFTPMLGLYPAPFVPSANSGDSSSSSSSSSSPSSSPSSEARHIVKYYTFLGRFLARVLLDRRIPNLRLSRSLLKMLRGDELAFDDIYSINPKIYEVLLAIVMSDSAAKKNNTANATAAEDTASSPPPQKGMLTALGKPCSIEDLCLNFTLPGMEEIPLCPNGADTDVTADNMAAYAQELATMLLCSSVNVAVKALREGFSSVINLQALRALSLDELSGILKGHEERISLAELEANVACDHGYSASSPTIRIFLEILAEMSLQEQQKFFQFLTGSPMLPVGGLAALKPKFTIVRKTSSDPKVPEQSQLPSAMTCQNFLKLPAYETKELMASKLKMAIDEGANAFLFT